MRKPIIVGAATLLTALAFTGCRPPLMLSNTVPNEGTHQAPPSKTSTDHPAPVIQCFRAPCP